MSSAAKTSPAHPAMRLGMGPLPVTFGYRLRVMPCTKCGKALPPITPPRKPRIIVCHMRAPLLQAGLVVEQGKQDGVHEVVDEGVVEGLAGDQEPGEQHGGADLCQQRVVGR